MAFLSRGIRNQYIAAVSVCMCVLVSAACHSWATPLLPRLLSPASTLPLAPPQLVWVISVLELGRLISPLPATLISNLVGRKMLLLSTAPLYLLSWTVVLRYQSAISLAVARFIQGFAIGLVESVAAGYIIEVAEPKTRGQLTRLIDHAWWLGCLLQYIVGPQLELVSFTYFTMALNIPFGVMLLWQPESAAFYLLWGDDESATQSLLWFRDGSVDIVKRELEEMKLDLDINRKSATFRELISTSTDKKGVLVLSVILTARVLSGHSVVTMYSTHIFDHIPDLPFSPYTGTVFVGLATFLGSVFSTNLMEQYGRKQLLLTSSLGSIFCHLCTAAYFFIQFHLPTNGIGWLPPLAIMVYCSIHSVAMIPSSTAYTSELFRSPVRSVVSSLAGLQLTTVTFVMLSIYEPIRHDYGMHSNFLIFAVACFLGTVYFYFFVPETKGKSFFQIRKELCGAKSDERSAEREPLFVDVDIDQL